MVTLGVTASAVMTLAPWHGRGSRKGQLLTTIVAFSFLGLYPGLAEETGICNSPLDLEQPLGSYSSDQQQGNPAPLPAHAQPR